MSEEKTNGFLANDIDLGSDTAFSDFPAFDGADFGDLFEDKSSHTEVNTDSVVSDTAATEETNVTVQGDGQNDEHTGDKTDASEAEETKPNSGTSKSEEQDPFEAALAQATAKEAEKTKSSLISKLPIFQYANAKEEIADTSKTFDELRNEKAEDFPELDDGTSVTWKMTYGTISKSVSNPKKTTIASLKTQIEGSKEFLEYLKKAKGEVECKVTPSVTAKKKGQMSSYKGVFVTLEDAATSGKAIAYVPSDDGKVYEVRPNRIGTFITPTEKVSMLRKVRAGFIPALPKIPYSILSEILSFFKAYITENGELEALAFIYWSVEEEKYRVYVPKQTVSKASVDSSLPDIDEDKFILVMEIHSHNTMTARFSPTDDRDEKATRLYTVVGRMDKVFPDITTRASVGGKYIEVDPETVFERFEGAFPESWKEAVEAVTPKKKEVIE